MILRRIVCDRHSRCVPSLVELRTARDERGSVRALQLDARMERILPVSLLAIAFAACSTGANETPLTNVEPTPNGGSEPEDPIFEDEGFEETPGDAGPGGPDDGPPPTCPEAPSGFRPMASFASVGPATTSFTRSIAAPVWTGREALFVGTSTVPGCATCEELVAGAYDPTTDTWRRLPSPPLPVGVQLHAFWTGSTWALFSSASSGPTGAELDLDGGTWSIIPAPPGVRRGAQAFAFVPTTREVVMWGGLGRASASEDEQTSNAGAAYSFVTRTYRELPPSPIGPRMLARAAWNGDRVVFAWGFVFDPELEGWRAEPGVAAWDPATNTWLELPDPGVTPRLREVDATVDGLATFFGGAPAIGDGDFWPHAPDGVAFDGSRWISIPPVPLAGHPYRTGYASWVARGRLYVWGGEAVQEADPFFFRLDDGASWDPATGTWTLMPSGGPAPRSSAVAVWTGCDAIIYGGTRSDVPFANDGMLFRP